jgi:hypothetical protein
MARQLLRLVTAGSVDDGKSTLIGRLLFDSKTLFADQLAVERTSRERGEEYPNLGCGRPGVLARELLTARPAADCGRPHGHPSRGRTQRAAGPVPSQQ